jgi:hypothetical protein
MGYLDAIELSEDARMEYIRNLALATNIEIAEFMQELPWKPWKPGVLIDEHKERAARELIDVLIFWCDMWIALDPEISLETAIAETLSKIERRIYTTDYGIDSVPTTNKITFGGI